MLARAQLVGGTWVGLRGAGLPQRGARMLASNSGVKRPSAHVMSELLRGIGAKHSGARNVLAGRLAAILSPDGGAPPSTLLRAFTGSKAGKDPAAEAEAMRAAREALETLLVEKGMCTPEGIPELAAALASSQKAEPPSMTQAQAAPPASRWQVGVSAGHESAVRGESAGRVAPSRLRQRESDNELPAELVMTSTEDSSVARLREAWGSASKRERREMVGKVLKSRMKSLYRRCLDSARRCPDQTWSDTMYSYVQQRFRDKTQSPGALAVLIAQGEHELANMELMHAAREQKLEEQKRLHTFVRGARGAIEDGAGRGGSSIGGAHDDGGRFQDDGGRFAGRAFDDDAGRGEEYGKS